jgi:hypothetical protein
MQLEPGAKEFWFMKLPKAVPQVVPGLKMKYSVGLVPPSAPAVIFVSRTLPVLVNVNAWIGSLPQVAPGQLRVTVPKLCAAGVKVTVRTAATPVPLRVTGEPATATLAVMVTVP